MSVPIAEWAPDLPPTANGGFGIILDCDKAVPSMAGYRSRPAPEEYAPALPANPLGAYIALFSNGTLKVYAGTSDHLYRLDSGVWTVVDSVVTFSATQRWRFTQFNDDVIAVNGSVTLPLVAAGAAANFANLGGTPPNNLVTVISVGGVLVGYVGAAWANSAAGTDNNWTPNIQTQAATGTLYDYPGPITAAAPFFRNQVVFKQASMYSLQFVGGSDVWFNSLASNLTGTWGQECVCITPEAIYFIGNDDFWVTQGSTPTRVPNNIKEWFFRNIYRDANLNPVHLSDTWSWYDPENAVIYWHFVSKASPFISNPLLASICDRYVSYNIRASRWGTGYLNTPCVVGNTQPGLTHGLYFDTNNVLQGWTGDPTTMGLLTGFAGDQSVVTQMLKARAMYADGLYPSSDVITPLGTYVLGKSAIVGTPGVKGIDDFSYFRQSTKFHQLHLVTNGDTEITGFAYEARASGDR